jgi:hypothetical protein
MPIGKLFLAEEFPIEEIEYFPYVNTNFTNVMISKCGKVRQNDANCAVYNMIKTRYQMAQLKDNNGKWRILYLHRMLGETFLPNPNNNRIIDHIDRNRLNNSIDNLRWVSYTENNINRKVQSNNKTGFRGVRKQGNKYIATLCNNYLGSFDTAELAYQKYLQELNTLFPHIQF